jgi:nitrate/nitrite-specific signal transduction histidine kinase
MKRRGFVAAAAGVPLGLTGLLRASPAQAQVTDLNDAINKAGRLRMLSQRMAKSYYAMGQGVVTEQAQRVLAASMALFERQFSELKAFASQPAIQATYAELDAAWRDYKTALSFAAPDKAKAAAVALNAGKVLALAHQGTGQFEKELNQPVGRLVNMSGRQRMLSQRMAAMYLSASWDVQAAVSTAEMSKARDEFTAAHTVLKSAPQATTAIKAELELAQMQFEFFESALRGLAPGRAQAQQMTDVFTTSERILQVMDKVTGMYAKLT